jgi:ribonuclease P protein component
METLRRRADFLAAGRGTRTVRPGFIIQAAPRPGEKSTAPPRFGFTVTKKIGNAVVRNRIRRRLRAAAKAAALHGKAGTDYVLIARTAALTLPFERLVTDLIAGLSALVPAERPKGGTSQTGPMMTGPIDGK